MLCIKIPEQFNRKDTPVIYSFIGKKSWTYQQFWCSFWHPAKDSPSESRRRPCT